MLDSWCLLQKVNPPNHTSNCSWEILWDAYSSYLLEADCHPSTFLCVFILGRIMGDSSVCLGQVALLRCWQHLLGVSVTQAHQQMSPGWGLKAHPVDWWASALGCWPLKMIIWLPGHLHRDARTGLISVVPRMGLKPIATLYCSLSGFLSD